MTRKAYVGNDDKARNVTQIYVGVNGTARRVVKGYVGDNKGVARQFWPPHVECPYFPPEYAAQYDSYDQIDTSAILSEQAVEETLSRARLNNPLNDVGLSSIT
jgi:hypothetical protein